MALAYSEYLARALEQPLPLTTPARHPSTFTRWAAEASADADAEAALSLPAGASGSLPTPASAWLALAPSLEQLEPLYKASPSLNSLLALARVELSCLAVDGLAVPNNERLTDRSVSVTRGAGSDGSAGYRGGAREWQNALPLFPGATGMCHTRPTPIGALSDPHPSSMWRHVLCLALRLSHRGRYLCARRRS
jgi:hypothetical protein